MSTVADWIRERPRHRRRIIDDEFFERWADHRRAVGILRDRHRDRQAVAAGSHARIPAAGDDCVALAHEKAVACVGSAGRIIAAASVVEDAQNAEGREEWAVEIAPVVHVIEQPTIPICDADRLEDDDVHLVLDHSSGVAGREVDVRDYLVARIGRVHFAKRTQP